MNITFVNSLRRESFAHPHRCHLRVEGRVITVRSFEGMSRYNCQSLHHERGGDISFTWDGNIFTFVSAKTISRTCDIVRVRILTFFRIALSCLVGSRLAVSVRVIDRSLRATRSRVLRKKCDIKKKRNKLDDCLAVALTKRCCGCSNGLIPLERKFKETRASSLFLRWRMSRIC